MAPTTGNTVEFQPPESITRQDAGALAMNAMRNASDLIALRLCFARKIEL